MSLMIRLSLLQHPWQVLRPCPRHGSKPRDSLCTSHRPEMMCCCCWQCPFVLLAYYRARAEHVHVSQTHRVWCHLQHTCVHQNGGLASSLVAMRALLLAMLYLMDRCMYFVLRKLVITKVNGDNIAPTFKLEAEGEINTFPYIKQQLSRQRWAISIRRKELADVELQRASNTSEPGLEEL